MEQEGAKRVEIDEKDDNASFWMLHVKHLSPSSAGISREENPSFQFPLDWTITHTVNHWSNE